MEKMRMESLDMTAQNIEKIGALFPNCITETVDENGKPKQAINFELLKQMLSGDVIEGSEAYEFTWVGKKAAIVEANKPIRKTLRPCKEDSVNWDTTENLYIEGDNLDILKLLQESYLEKVKMIYIDPPYNTGKDSFLYPDNFYMDADEYEDEVGLYDDEGNKLFLENTNSNPRFHSLWCSMMYSRLMLARDMLTDDGVIFISIDEKEITCLTKICDEIFGASNHLETFHIQVRYGNKSLNEDSDFQPVMEYVLIYCKDHFSFVPQKPSEPYDLSKFCFKGVKMPKKGEAKVTHLNNDQMDNVLSAVYLDFEPQDPMYVGILLAFYAGLRRGEICGLRWNDKNTPAPAANNT